MRVFRAVKHVTVGVKRETRAGMAELAADEDDVQTLPDQQRREGVPEVVETESRLPVTVQTGSCHCRGCVRRFFQPAFGHKAASRGWPQGCGRAEVSSAAAVAGAVAPAP